MKTILVDALDAFVIEGEGVYKPMHDLLEAYPNPKLVVSNANDEQIIEWGLDSLPYELFTLKHNPDKPDPIYFETLLKEKGLTAQDVIYFEHNPKAVESARSIGIVAYHYDSEKKDISELKAFLDNNK